MGSLSLVEDGGDLSDLAHKTVGKWLLSSSFNEHAPEAKESAKRMLFSLKDFESFILSAGMHLCLSEGGKPLQRPQKGQSCLQLYAVSSHHQMPHVILVPVSHQEDCLLEWTSHFRVTLSFQHICVLKYIAIHRTDTFCICLLSES